MSFNGFFIGETDYFPRYVYKSDVLREENMSTVIEKGARSFRCSLRYLAETPEGFRCKWKRGYHYRI